jgi:hypothetical protein
VTIIRRLARGAGSALAAYAIFAFFIGAIAAPIWWPRIPQGVQEGIAIFLVLGGFVLILIALPLFIAYSFGGQE